MTGNRKSRAAAALVATGLAAIALAATGDAPASSQPSPTTAQTEVLRFLEVEDKVEFIDVGEPAQSDEDVGPGDMVVEENILRNTTNTRTLGESRMTCQNLVTPGVLHCNGTAILRDGTIEIAGTVDFTREQPRPLPAVTGGTGRFKNVAGQLKVALEVRPGTDEFTFELSRPGS
jgi:hypothetical protein